MLYITLKSFFSQNQRLNMNQEVIAWGWFAWKGGNSGPITLDFLNDVGGVQQVVCAEKVMAVLAGNGNVYFVSYNSESAVSWSVFTFGNFV